MWDYDKDILLLYEAFIFISQKQIYTQDEGFCV